MRNTNGNFLSVQTKPMWFKGVEDEVTPYWILREKEDSEQDMCNGSCDDRGSCEEKLERGRQKRILLARIAKNVKRLIVNEEQDEPKEGKTNYVVGNAHIM